MAEICNIILLNFHYLSFIYYFIAFIVFNTHVFNPLNPELNPICYFWHY